MQLRRRIRPTVPATRIRLLGLAAGAAVLVASTALASPTSHAQGGAAGSVADVPADYEPTVESLNSHRTPRWFDDAKFGIFVHWGAYSVPAWGPRGSYAEWYWSALNNPTSATHAYHRATYGEQTPYDSFIGQWRAEKFDPDAWVKLFEEAGAKYFVLTSKHHEGVALFDSKVTGRDTVDMGPHRDLVADLFKAARASSDLKAGLYYSLYEWNNPAYTGRPVRNPYTGETVPYTGAAQVGSYVDDLMVPQLRELISQYDPDIIWCDGEWEKPASYWKTAPVIADYYNQAKNRANPKDVAVADRCKINVGREDPTELDFQTPEYTVKPDIDPVKWESSRGIAHSYGFNQNEPVSDYLTSNELVDSLVNIVSKNGNLLLDIGPRADGTIPELQQQRLRDIGTWLGINGEAIYGTTYWNRAEEPSSDDKLRYTVKDGSLYATALEWPGSELTLGADLPVYRGSRITLLGSDGSRLAWHRDDQGRVVVTMPEAGPAATTSEHAYVFKITTPGVNSLLRIKPEFPQEIPPGTSASAALTVANTSTRAISRPADVSVAGPPGWKISPSSTRLNPLAPGAEASIGLTVEIPPDAAPGQHELTVTVSTGRTSDRLTIPVTADLRNLSSGKAATQKSTAWGGTPARAVDGNTDGTYNNGSVTHTAEPSNQAWWQVDLGAAAKLARVDVWNRSDACCASRLQDYWVIVSNDPITAQGLDEARSAPGVTAVHVTGQAGRPSQVQLPSGAAGRYVRVQLSSSTNPLSLAEVQVREAATP